MEILVELEPVKSREKLVKRVESLIEVADWVDVPDSPLGVTRFFSPMVSCFVKAARVEVKVIAHVRLLDLNRLAFESIVKTLEVCNVERIVPLTGDIIPGYVTVKDLSSEEAVALVKSIAGKLSPGLLLSLAKTLDEIERRVEAPADFYLVLNLTRENLEKIEAVSSLARRRGKLLYPYVILLGERSATRVPEKLRARGLSSEEALEVVGALEGLVEGVLLSAPGDFSLLLETARALRRRA
ncbi:MAG: hypothetical protein QXS85_00255 [Acidilobaceae archaeon]